MKNLIKTVLGIFIKSKIEQRKQKIKAKLEKEISTTTSEWVKARNTGFLALIDSANNKILDEIEKSIVSTTRKTCGLHKPIRLLTIASA